MLYKLNSTLIGIINMMNDKELMQVRKNYNDAKLRSASSTKTKNNEAIPMKHKDDGQDDVTVERSARNDFDSSVAIRAEFENVDRYIAFRKAEARGNMKILGGVVRGQS